MIARAIQNKSDTVNDPCELLYCPRCEAKIVLSRSTFECWNDLCSGCNDVKYADYITDAEHYSRVHK